MIKFCTGTNFIRCICNNLVLCIGLFFTSGAVQAQTLVLNDTSGPPFTTVAGDGFLDILVGKAFNDVGLTLKLIKGTPSERALLNGNAGIDDGELLRVKGIDKLYTNLVRVPEKLVEWNFVAFTRNPDISIHSWDDLMEYNIGLIRGWKILEKNTQGHKKISIVRSPKELFSMLDKNRIDIALYSKWLGLELLKRRNIQGVRAVEPPLATRAMYIYLNKKHSAYVSKIAVALKGMKDRGEYQQLFAVKIEQLYSQQP